MPEDQTPCVDRPVRLAVDIGGTFTDLVIEHPEGRHSRKVLTTPDAPERAVLDGTRELLEDANLAAGSVQLVIHGTTLATNALIERKGARAALLTTEGFRDSIEMAYEHRFEQYDLYMTRPAPLVPRERRFGVPERIAADGAVLRALDEEHLEQLASELLALDVSAVAIGFLHSYANPEHEQRAGEILGAALPGVAITLSHDVCPEIREYERLSTACANAYVQPLMAGYLGRLNEGLARLGVRANVLMMMSSGGVTTIDTAMRQPIRLVESGPAGGAILAAHVARQVNADRALSFDMGGTTAKLTLIDEFRPQHSRSFEVARAYRFLKGSGLPLRIPVIDMVEIGAGGGSIARLDALGQIAVGPDSAGAAPGPACYGIGGSQPTVTDGDLLLGRIDAAGFAAGTMPLEQSAAASAVDSNLAEPAGMDSGTAAAGIIEIVDENMANAARVHAIENGKETRGRTMIAFGGAAPLHAGRLAEKLEITHVVVPPGAGVGSAHGFLQAPIAYEVVRTRLMSLSSFSAARLNSLFGEMRTEAEQVVRLGAPTGELRERREAFMRYRGQGHEITVELPVRPYHESDGPTLQQAFDDAYAAVFGRVIPRLSVEALTWSLALSTVTDHPAAEHPELPPVPAPAALVSRPVFDAGQGRFIDNPCYSRPRSRAGRAHSRPSLDRRSADHYRGARFIPSRRRRGWKHHFERQGTPMSDPRFEQIRLQVMWNRLLSVVEEQAQTLVRTAFSTSTREAGDVSAGIFNLQGQMLAQAVTGTPGHVNSMARAVVHFINEIPIDTMCEGDAYVTNDPWKGTGHLHDLTVVSPAFKDGRMVALFACTSHLVDIGGVGLSPDGRQVYHEGLYIPIMPLARSGEMDEWLLKLIRHNVREPIQAEGDIYALVSCNDTGAKRLLAIMDEYRLDNLNALGEHIISRSREGMVRAIEDLPKGTWHAAMRIDGYDGPVDLVAALTIAADHIAVDYSGTSGISTYGINCPMCYTEAYTAFGIRCVVGPEIPNNAGTLDLIKVTAPENTIVNALPPAAVVARSTIGHMMPDVVYGCLNQALPDTVPAEGTSNLWNLKLGAGHGLSGRGSDNQTPFMVTSFHSGGAGARPALDGLSATPFPSGVRNVPVEITEAITPIVVWKKEFRTDSGGPGRQRGGLGQVMEVSNREDAPFAIFASFERVDHPARGRDGGKPGANGRLSVDDTKTLRAKGYQVVPAGGRLRVEMPGGGGFGPPQERPSKAVLADVRQGLVSREQAREQYSVVIDSNLQLDEAATARCRGDSG